MLGFAVVIGVLLYFLFGVLSTGVGWITSLVGLASLVATPLFLLFTSVDRRGGWKPLRVLGRLLFLLFFGGYLPSVCTLSMINAEARVRAESWVKAELQWNPLGVPTTSQQLAEPADDGQPRELDPARVGVEADDMPVPFLKAPPPGGNYWSADASGEYWKPGSPRQAENVSSQRRADRFVALLFSDGDLPPIDRVFRDAYQNVPVVRRVLGDVPAVPFQGLRKEKKLREELFQQTRFEKESKQSDLAAAVGEDQAVQSAVNRHFANVYGTVMQDLRIRVIRWCNGWVQFLTFMAFWLAVVLLARNYLANVTLETLVAERYQWPESSLGRFLVNLIRGRSTGPAGYYPFAPLRPDDRPFTRTWLTTTGELDRVFGERVDHGIPPGRPTGNPNPFRDRLVVRMLRAVYEAFLIADVLPEARERGTLYDVLDKITQNRLKRLESEMASIVYLAWAIPSLGFIGTVLGIGDALLNAGDMLTPNTDLQKDAIQAITLSLGFAFDTTLIALVLSLVLMLSIYLCRRAEERVVLTFQSRIMDELISRLRA
ncbi:MotA/TolQ/ExbB proton channel family protein [Paludisphaera sp.]|uniref:MotA/TolQ/ExbB proton channel family protein n=1 Tax=Paludisphaera sp. TaxID=2017432 RepID=UPI00301C96DE